MPKMNGKGSIRRCMTITRAEETKRWGLAMRGVKVPPSCDYCAVKSLRSICAICRGYDQFSPEDLNAQHFDTVFEA